MLQFFKQVYMQKRRYFYILIVFLSFLIVSSVLFIKLKLNNNKVDLPISAVPAPPKIPKFYKGEIKMQFILEPDILDIPKTLPALKSKENFPLTESSTLEIAKLLGFDANNFKIAKDNKRGNTYFWNKDSESLIIYSKSNEIVYTNNKESFVNKQLSDKEIISLAVNHIMLIPWYKDKILENVSISYIKSSPSDEEVRIVQRSEAGLFLVNISPINTGYRLISINPMYAPISVYVSVDGTVVKSKIQNLTPEPTLETYGVKSFEDIKASAGEAKVVSLDEGNVFIYDLTDDEIKEIAINNIEIAYLVDSANKDLYLPVFLLRGTTKINTKDVEVSLYLFAYK